MADRPIIFSAPMIRALLGGRKTQTRRAMKPQPTGLPRDARLYYSSGKLSCTSFVTPGGPWFGVFHDDGKAVRQTHYVGDRLWVKEAWTKYFDTSPFAVYRANYDDLPLPPTVKWKSPLFMKRCDSRITLTVTDVRVQRLQEISEEDARAEGISPLPAGRYYCGEDEDGPITAKSAITAYGWLWNSINGERPGCHWQDNPWVCAVSFTVHRVNIDQMKEAA